MSIGFRTTREIRLRAPAHKLEQVIVILGEHIIASCPGLENCVPGLSGPGNTRGDAHLRDRYVDRLLTFAGKGRNLSFAKTRYWRAG